MFSSRYNVLAITNPVNELLNLYNHDQVKPFKLHWLNSAHLGTLLPGSKWQKIYDTIIPEFCDKINSEFADETKKQVLFSLLGKNFVSKYFPQHSADVTVTKPPYTTLEESNKLYEEGEHFLSSTMEKIMKDKSIFDSEKNVASDDMKDYIKQAEHIFTDHFCKELGKKETEYLKNISTMKRNFRNSSNLLHHKPDTPVSSVYDQDLPDIVENIYPYGPEMMIAHPPHFNSYQSEFIGSSIANITRHSGEKEFRKVIQKMLGRRLPISLRKFIWKNTLLQSESSINIKDINFEEIIMDKFSKTVTRGISELKVSKDFITPVNDLVEHSIVDVYEKCPPLHQFNVHFQREAVKILNILYAYDRSYDHHLIFLLFPLHFGLKEDIDDVPVNTPFLHEMAMYLSLLKTIYPSWESAFKMSEDVMSRLDDSDSGFAKHLLKVAQTNANSQSTELLGEIIDLRKSIPNELKTSTKPRNSRIHKKLSNLSNLDLMKSPIMFIRKWIAEGYVSVLKNAAMLYIFDQLFMENFSPTIFEDACLAVILLLENDFKKAQDHETMKNVFLNSPFNLFTLDIIRAWTWIHRGGNLKEVPKMNRREVHLPPEPTVKPVSRRQSSAYILILPDVAFNDIKLKLIFDQSTDSQVDFLKDLKDKNIFVTITMYLQENNLLELVAENHIKLKTKQIHENNRITHSYYFDPDQTVRFHELDVSHMKKKFKEGDTFYVLIKVQYGQIFLLDLTLGWCTFQCFVEDEHVFEVPKMTSSQLLKPKKERKDNKFKEYVLRLKARRIREEIPLIIGKVPKNFIDFVPENVKYDEDNLLMNGSMLGIHVFDPETIPSPPPKTPVEEIKTTPTQEERLPTPVFPHTIKYHPKPRLPGKARPNDDSYVPFNSKNYDKIKPAMSSKIDPFCIYIDQVRFIPDNATIIKVTGRLLQTGFDDDIPSFTLYPDVETNPRSPSFRANTRVVFNENKRSFQNSALLILRVYTILKTTLEIMVIGNCIIPVFDLQEGTLNAGCYQKRLRNELPDLELAKSNSLQFNCLDNASYIECASITLRVWPFTKKPVSAPNYRNGCYQSAECEPSDFEWEVFNLYKNDSMFPKDLRYIVRYIKLRDNNPEFQDDSVEHSFMQTYIPYRMDVSTFLPENQAPKHFETELMFHYRIDKGIHFKVEQIYGIKDDVLMFVTAKVLRGRQTAFMEPRPGKKYGVDEFLIFSELDPNHPIQSSKWNDQFKLIRPYFDTEALLVVQVWGIDGCLINKEFCHKETGKKIDKLTKDMLIGWTAIDLFKEGFVYSAKHHLPLFRNRLHLALLKNFQAASIISVLQKEDEFKDTNSARITVYLLDGHTSLDDYPSDLPFCTDILDSLHGKKGTLQQSLNSEYSGRTVYSKVLELTKDVIIDESQGEDYLPLFYKIFSNLAKKLSTSIRPKQPYMPIFL